MTPAEIQALLSQANNAIVGVNRADGGPQLTPVWYAWDGNAFYFTTTKTRAKYMNLQRDPSITLIVDDFASHNYVTAYGRAEIIERDFTALLRPVIAKYVAADKVEQRVKQVTDDPSRVLIVVRPQKMLTL
jgi:PPOX class probable F420-dependent enzyme